MGGSSPLFVSRVSYSIIASFTVRIREEKGKGGDGLQCVWSVGSTGEYEGGGKDLPGLELESSLSGRAQLKLRSCPIPWFLLPGKGQSDKEDGEVDVSVSLSLSVVGSFEVG